VRLPCGDVPLPRASDAALAGYAGREVLLGIRPEDLYEAHAPAAQPMARLHARVLAVEPLGAETLVVVALDSSSDEMTARLGRDTSLRVGDRFDIAVDGAAIHMFDPVTTKAIV
jgi:multiple sugar transport system ATP-binding protein